MQKQSAETLINTLESQVESQLAEVVRTFQNMPTDVLTKPRADGGWSVAQCLWHLNSYSDYYLPSIEKGLSNGYPVSNTFSSTWLGAYFTKLMQPGEKMKKMKAFKNHNPPQTVDPHKAVAKFIQHQEKLLMLLRLARLADLNRIRIGISILPWMKLKLGDVFQFLITHQERHIQQAGRLRLHP